MPMQINPLLKAYELLKLAQARYDILYSQLEPSFGATEGVNKVVTHLGEATIQRKRGKKKARTSPKLKALKKELEDSIFRNSQRWAKELYKLEREIFFLQQEARLLVYDEPQLELEEAIKQEQLNLKNNLTPSDYTLKLKLTKDPVLAHSGVPKNDLEKVTQDLKIKKKTQGLKFTKNDLRQLVASWLFDDDTDLTLYEYYKNYLHDLS
jgi:hypothetical protein